MQLESGTVNGCDVQILLSVLSPESFEVERGPVEELADCLREIHLQRHRARELYLVKPRHKHVDLVCLSLTVSHTQTHTHTWQPSSLAVLYFRNMPRSSSGAIPSHNVPFFSVTQTYTHTQIVYPFLQFSTWHILIIQQTHKLQPSWLSCSAAEGAVPQ